MAKRVIPQEIRDDFFRRNPGFLRKRAAPDPLRVEKGLIVQWLDAAGVKRGGVDVSVIEELLWDVQGNVMDQGGNWKRLPKDPFERMKRFLSALRQMFPDIPPGEFRRAWDNVTDMG